MGARKDGRATLKPKAKIEEGEGEGEGEGEDESEANSEEEVPKPSIRRPSVCSSPPVCYMN